MTAWGEQWKEHKNELKNERHALRLDRHRRSHIFWGLALIITGAAFLGDRLGYFNLGTNLIWEFVPAFIALTGLFDIVIARRASHAIKGAFRVALGFWLYACIEGMWGWTFSTSWPIILIAYGISVALRGMFNLRGQDHEENE
jgi:hypothetical protein